MYSLCIILDSKVLENFHLQMLVLGYQKQFQTLNRKQKCQISRKYLTTHMQTNTHTQKLDTRNLSMSYFFK